MNKRLILFLGKLFLLCMNFAVGSAQDYEVRNINCSSSYPLNGKEYFFAELKRPRGYQGDPILADKAAAANSEICQIRKIEGSSFYALGIKNYEKCGVKEEAGFLSVRVWFPKVLGVVTLSDQEVIIICTPPRNTIVQNKAASYTAILPPAAKVSGIVEEVPESLQYEVALYKDSRKNDGLPIVHEVPIGTLLQLRASINTESAWKYIKLVDVSISPNSRDPNAQGHIHLIRNGCRQKEFLSIVPRRPFYPKKQNGINYGEIRLEFEAIILQASKAVNRLWMHAKIKGCVHKKDCAHEICSEYKDGRLLTQRWKRDINTSKNLTSIHSESQTDFDDNVGFTVVMPGEKISRPSNRAIGVVENCYAYLVIASLIGSLLIMASFLMCILSLRLYGFSKSIVKLDDHNSLESYDRFPTLSTATS